MMKSALFSVIAAAALSTGAHAMQTTPVVMDDVNVVSVVDDTRQDRREDRRDDRFDRREDRREDRGNAIPGHDARQDTREGRREDRRDGREERREERPS